MPRPSQYFKKGITDDTNDVLYYADSNVNLVLLMRKLTIHKHLFKERKNSTSHKQFSEIPIIGHIVMPVSQPVHMTTGCFPSHLGLAVGDEQYSNPLKLAKLYL